MALDGGREASVQVPVLIGGIFRAGVVESEKRRSVGRCGAEGLISKPRSLIPCHSYDWRAVPDLGNR